LGTPSFFHTGVAQQLKRENVMGGEKRVSYGTGEIKRIRRSVPSMETEANTKGKN